MDEEQAVFEQLTLSYSKKVEFHDIKDLQQFHHNNDQQYWHNKNIMSVVFLSLLLIFELIQQASMVNFVLFLNIFQILNIRFWTFWRENSISLAL